MRRKSHGISISAVRPGRLGAAIGLVLLLAAGSFAAFDQMTRMGDNLEEIARHEIPLSDILTRLTAKQLEQEIALQRLFRHGEEIQAGLSQSPRFEAAVDRFEHYAEAAATDLATANRLARSLSEQARSPAQIERAQAIAQALGDVAWRQAAYRKEANRVVDLLRSGNIEPARSRLTAMEVEEEAIRKLLQELGDTTAISIGTATNAAVEHENLAFYWLVVIGSVVALAALAFVGRDYLAVPAANRRTRRDGPGPRV